MHEIRKIVITMNEEVQTTLGKIEQPVDYNFSVSNGMNLVLVAAQQLRCYLTPEEKKGLVASFVKELDGTQSQTDIERGQPHLTLHGV